MFEKTQNNDLFKSFADVMNAFEEMTKLNSAIITNDCSIVLCTNNFMVDNQQTAEIITKFRAEKNTDCLKEIGNNCFIGMKKIIEQDDVSYFFISEKFSIYNADKNTDSCDKVLNPNEINLMKSLTDSCIAGVQNSIERDSYINKYKETNVKLAHEQQRNREMYAEYRESENRYKKLTNATFEGIIIHENAFIIDSNLVINKMLGYDYEALNGANLFDYIDANWTDTAKVFFGKYESAKTEICMKHKDGFSINVEMFSKPFIYKKRTVKVIAVRDITERKKNERELNNKNKELEHKIRELNWAQTIIKEARADQQKFVELVENSSDFITISDLSFNIIYTNPAAVEGLHIGKNKPITNFADIFTETERTKRHFLEKISMGIKDKGHWRGEMKHTNTKTGEKMVLHINSFYIHKPNTKEPLYIATIQRDITDLKTIQKQLDEKNRMLKENMQKLREANDELITSEEELRQNTEELRTSNEYLERTRNELELALKKEKEITIELDRANRELQNAHLQLVEKEKMATLGLLTAGIAHEINNPINFVSSNIVPLKLDFTELKGLLEHYRNIESNTDINQQIEDIKKIEKKIDPDFLYHEVYELLYGIEEGAKRTKEIVLGLRNFSRLDENEFKRINVNESIDTTLMLLTNRTKNKIQLIKKYCPEAEIECIPGKINQVFMNIITNGIQAIEETGNIFITTECEDKFVVIKIKDTGKGMPENVKNKIFEPFFTTKDAGKGTGLGLSITHSIIEKHKGSIWVETNPNEGTEFIIKLPKNQSY